MRSLSFMGLALVAMVGLGSVATVSTGCGDDEEATPGPKPVETTEGGPSPVTPPESFKATVRRTSLGVPHIKADDLGGLGYGYGYAFAEDNVCLLLEEIITVRGERAKWFGDVPYDLGNTQSSSNVKSDAVYKMLMTKDVVDKSRAALDGDQQRMVRGYAAGVSRYVRELKEGKYTGRHATCRNEGWLREITEEDMYFRFYKLSLLASSANFIDGLAAGQPIQMSKAPPPSEWQGSEQQKKEVRDGLTKIAPKFMAMRTGELGSNMYAFGSEVTDTGKGIQFGNPHFPWFGGERLYQVHLTIPGKIDIQGASLYGVPVVLIGFTDTFAWSHTVSTGYRFTPYQLKLKAGDQFTYIKDGQEKKITPVPLEIEVKGEAAKRTVTLYKSEYGPMIYLGNGQLTWDTDQAFTIRDANAENFRLIRHYARWNQAKSLEEFKKIHAEEVAVPWVNTTAADKDGNVYYADITVIPNVPDALADKCKAPRSALLSSAVGLPLLDGTKAECDWVVDPASPQPGIFAAGSLPKTDRKDYVVNCNDSYWLTNPSAPITGYAKIIGPEKVKQSLRSRLCHQQVLDRLAGTDGEQGNKVTVAAVKNIVLGSRVYSAQKWKARFTTTFCANPTISLTKDPLDDKVFSPAVVIDTAAACTALNAWDNRNNSDSKGSALWDEFWFRAEPLINSTAFPTANYTKLFDPLDAVNTPSDPGTTAPELAQAFAAAIHSMNTAGIALDSARSVVSYREGKGGPTDRIPVPGGFQRTGNFTIAQTDSPKLKAGTGYGPMNYGNSYIQVVTWGANGPDASTFITYSQSTDTASDHYDDYTRRYSNKEWLKAAFTEADIAADTKATTELQQ